MLRQSGLKAKKGLGQHFLIDEKALETIVIAAELSPEDIVIEVGPGLGVLTIELARRAGKVIAVELDTKLASLLKRRLASLPNVNIVNADILKVSPSQLLGGENNYKVVANLPYYVTSPILRYFVEASPKPSLMVVMVQKEVGIAIAASPGKMSLLAISLQVYSKPKIISYVSSQSFYPPPKVDSAIVRFDLFPEPAVKIADIDGFFKVVRCGFSSPRKQLRNSLAHGLEVKPAEVGLLLEKARIEPQRRAETLSLEEWARLYEVLAASKKDRTLC
ncbi:MAG: ribosomal RNA small subunit methyltransferase A [Dehalococcoidia bacterium]|nr:MAG: ribosomal RNA small subunit methyltransferase A [Dehalococcoidia bacterium]